MGERIKILFDAYHLYHLPQFEPVIDLLKKDSRFDVFVSTSNAIDPSERDLCLEILRKRGDQICFHDDEEQRASTVRELAPDAMICGWSRYPLEQFVPNSSLVGMLYHGIGVKPSYWRDNHPRIDIRFVEGPFREKLLQEKGIQTPLSMTGYPKLDPLFNGGVRNREDLTKHFRLDPDKKTILYAPTFYPSSFEIFGKKLALFTKSYNLLIKPHPWVFALKQFAAIDLSNQRKLLYKLEEKFDHVRIVTPEFYNIVPFYQISDLLLTDASSTIFEMMALDKPIICCLFYKLKLSHRMFRNRLFKRRLNQELVDDGLRISYPLSKPDDLPSTLEKAFGKSDPFGDVRSEYKFNMLYHLDGKASERVRDSILGKIVK